MNDCLILMTKSANRSYKVSIAAFDRSPIGPSCWKHMLTTPTFFNLGHLNFGYYWSVVLDDDGLTNVHFEKGMDQ